MGGIVLPSMKLDTIHTGTKQNLNDKNRLVDLMKVIAEKYGLGTEWQSFDLKTLEKELEKEGIPFFHYCKYNL